METQKERAARYNRATQVRKPIDKAVKRSLDPSITHRRRRAKYLHRKIIALVVLMVMASLVACTVSRFTATDAPNNTAQVIEPAATKKPPTEAAEPHYDEVTDPAFSGYPEGPAPRYELSDAERDVVERVVMAEAGGESYEGQMLVAQCILNAAEKTGTAPSEVVVTYKYTKSRPEPTQSVRDAVAAVFDDGETITGEPVMYFYNPARVTSKWHESQIFVTEIGGHRFFSERSQQ